MVWVQLLWFLVTTVISIALAPKPKAPRSAAIEDFSFPTAEEGRPIPVVFGTVDITGPNVVWYGDLSNKKIKQSSGFSSATVGYRYFLGFHLGLCHGPVDAVTRIEWGEKEAWTGSITATGSSSIDQENLFGGRKREGGIQGDFDLDFGDEGQNANAYLVSKIGSDVPAYRGILSFVWKGGYVGTTSYVKPIKIRVKRVAAGWQGSTWYPETAEISGGLMNPAHIVYQCLTDSEWGMGIPTSFLNDAAFRAAADTFYDEGFGLGLLWNQQTQILEFLKIITDHCGASLALRLDTGQYELVAVRGDYELEDLPVFDPSNVVELTDYQRQGWGDTVNEVTLVYTDPDTGKDTTITAHDMGNVDAQALRIPATVEYRGIKNHDIARQVVARELQARVTPLAKVKMVTNRAAWNLPHNEVFRLTWPERNIEDAVFRILAINRGNVQDNTIVIDAVEDVYALELAEYLTNNPAEADPDPPPTPADDPDPGIGVISTNTSTPPINPYAGDRYFIPAGGSATGDWAGHEGEWADWDEDEQAWVFTPSSEGAIVYDEATGDTYQVQGGVLVPFGGGGSIEVQGITPVDSITFVDAQVTDLGSDDVAVQVSPSTTKGDLDTRTGAGRARLAVGPEGAYLRSRSAETTGLKWEAAPPVGEAASGGRVYRDTNQSVPDATLTALEWTDEDFDSDAYFDAGNASRLTAAIAGKYMVGATVQWDSNASGTRALYVAINGNTAQRMAAALNPAAAGLTQQVAMLLELDAGDYVEIYAEQDSGGARDIGADEEITSAYIARVGVTAAPTLMRGATWVRPGGAIATPVNDVHVRCPVKGVITGVTIGTEGGAGSCVVDIWKDTHANFPPTVADSICASAKPTISSDVKYEDTTLTGWTLDVDAGDWLTFHLESSATFTAIFVQLFVKETQ